MHLFKKCKSSPNQAQTKTFSNDLAQHRPNTFYGVGCFPPFSSFYVMLPYQNVVSESNDSCLGARIPDILMSPAESSP